MRVSSTRLLPQDFLLYEVTLTAVGSPNRIRDVFYLLFDLDLQFSIFAFQSYPDPEAYPTWEGS